MPATSLGLPALALPEWTRCHDARPGSNLDRTLNLLSLRRNLRLMIERFRGFAIVAAAVAAAGFSGDWAYAQSADLVLCDRVAADPAVKSNWVPQPSICPTTR